MLPPRWLCGAIGLALAASIPSSAVAGPSSTLERSMNDHAEAISKRNMAVIAPSWMQRSEDRSSEQIPNALYRRHGDHGDEDEEEEEEEEHEHEHEHKKQHGQMDEAASFLTATLHQLTGEAPVSNVMQHADASTSTASSMPTTATQSSSDHQEDAAGAHSHGSMQQAQGHTYEHGHGHNAGHGHTHAPHPYDGVPDPSIVGLAFIKVPPLAPGAGGHTHSHGGGPAAEELNETTILRGKGPDPLSYIEWDFTFGLGKPDELERFVMAYNGSTWDNLMGVADGRYRSLTDEKGLEGRKEVIQDLQSRVKASKEYPGRHRFLLVLHVLGCILSCFILLPVALAFRAASSSLAPLASLVYLATLAGSLFVSTLYKAMTPRLYPSNSHSGLGYAVFWLSLLALGGDVFRLVMQIWGNLKGLRGTQGVTRKTRLGVLMRSLHITPPRQDSSASAASDEYDALEEERMLSDDGSGMSDAREVDVERMDRPRRQGSSGSSSPPRSVHFDEERVHPPRRSSTNRSSSSHHHQDLPSPTSTLCNTPRTSLMGGEVPWKLSTTSHPLWRRIDEHKAAQRPTAAWAASVVAQKPKRTVRSVLSSILRYTHVTVARSIPIVSFAAAYTGLSVYTGSCRGPYKNVCLAHGIKGGIFFWYGLLSFGRYLGAYADMGWAWNKRPAPRKGQNPNHISAEWVECLVIFIYGATNTWMERFGSSSGDPYTVKQVQHISIAVMFWFAGLMGLILETKAFKSLLALPAALNQASYSRSSRRAATMSAEELVASNAAPPSYSFSFNPFPALVIGVTGVAMAAHHQDYVYEVSIHALWGNLLAGFSVLRMMTYFFLWLRPPTSSIMPSRPPTEALASFSLACGGLVFMLSSEEVSFVAMRNGFGDIMMIMNVTVAIISLLFCGVAGLMVLKAWALRREHLRARDGATIRLEDIPEAHDVEEGAGQRHGRHPAAASSSTHHHEQSTFVIGEDDEHQMGMEQDEKRLLSSSPENV